MPSATDGDNLVIPFKAGGGQPIRKVDGTDLPPIVVTPQCKLESLEV